LDIDVKSGWGELVWGFPLLTLPPPIRHPLMIDRIRRPNRNEILEMIF
jgi:hypothetical protein